MATDKYKEFRNYMTNELGISRADIEAWAKEAVANEIQKLIPRLAVGPQIETVIKREIDRALQKDPYGGPSRVVADAVGRVIASRVRVALAEVEE